MPTTARLHPSESAARSAARRGVTIGELLLVIAVLAVLIALLLPATRSARPAARRSQCVNNLKQIALALHDYESEHGALPPAYTTDARGRPLHSWRTLILPYLEQGPLYRAIVLARPWDDPANATARATKLGVFLCPEDVDAENKTTYLAIVGPAGYLAPGRPRPLAEITDGLSTTLAVIEAGSGDAVPWMAPIDADESTVMGLGPRSRLHHAGGTDAALADGSVKFLRADTPAAMRRALTTISGGDAGLVTDW